MTKQCPPPKQCPDNRAPWEGQKKVPITESPPPFFLVKKSCFALLAKRLDQKLVPIAHSGQKTHKKNTYKKNISATHGGARNPFIALDDPRGDIGYLALLWSDAVTTNINFTRLTEHLCLFLKGCGLGHLGGFTGGEGIFARGGEKQHELVQCAWGFQSVVRFL